MNNIIILSEDNTINDESHDHLDNSNLVYHTQKMLWKVMWSRILTYVAHYEELVGHWNVFRRLS